MKAARKNKMSVTKQIVTLFCNLKEKLELLKEVDLDPLDLTLQNRIVKTLEKGTSLVDNTIERTRSLTWLMTRLVSLTVEEIFVGPWNPVPFFGVISEWPSWSNWFKEAIGDREDLSGLTKMRYFTYCIGGDPIVVQKHVSLTGRYDEHTLEMMKDIYKNPIHLRQVYYEDLENLPAAVDDKSEGSTLKKVKELVKIIVAVDYFMADAVDSGELKTLVTPKFTENTLQEAIRLVNIKTRGFDYTIDDLLEVLEISIEDRRIRCSFCKGSHFTVSCTKYPCIYQRRQRLADTNRCFNCFQAGHISKMCKMPIAFCKHCRKRGHNSLLCKEVH